MSLHNLLIRLIWLCVGPMILLALYLAVSNVKGKQDERDIEVANLAKSFSTVIDQHLNARIGALHILSGSPLVDDASRWNDFYREAQGFHQVFGSHVIFADVEMHMLFNTRVPFGTKLPMLPRPKGHAAAPAAVTTGKPAVGDIFFGPIAREPLVAVAVPALREGKTAFLLLTIFEIRQFQELLDQVALPSGWSLAIRDGNHEAIARRAPPDLNPLTDVDASGRFVVKSAVSPWSLVIEIPRNIYRKPLIDTTIALGIAILGATLLSILGGIWISRRLGRSVASLAETPTLGAPPPDITEIAAVRHLLDKSAAEHKTAETALRQSENKFRQFFETEPEYCYMTSPAGLILDLNAAALRVLGYQKQEVVGKPLSMIYASESLSKMQSLFALWKETGILRDEEMVIAAKNGDRHTVLLSAAATKGDDGQVLFSVSVQRDITERKQAEAKIIASEALLNETQQLSKIGGWEYDVEERRLTWTDEVYRIYGVSPYEHDPNDITQDIAYYEDRNTIENAFRRAVEYGEPYDLELKFRNAGGKNLWVRTIGKAEQKEGRTVRVLGNIMEITERKKAEEKIVRLTWLYAVLSRINEAIVRTDEPVELYRQVCGIIVDVGGFRMAWIGVVDPDTLLVNPVAVYGHDDGYLKEKRISIDASIPEGRGPTGVAIREHSYFICNDIENDPIMAPWRDEAIKRGYRSSAALALKSGKEIIGTLNIYSEVAYFFQEEEEEEEEVKLLKALAEDISYAIESMEIEVLRLHAEHELQKLTIELEERVNNRTAELKDSQTALISIVEDLNQKSEELRVANERLKEVDRLKSVFIASMSHELRTPLNSVIGFSSILLNQWKGPINDDQEVMISTVLRSGKHLLSLINDVIDVSKIEAGMVEVHIEEFDLHDLIAEAVELIRKDITEKRLDLTVEVPHLSMKTDRRRLLQSVLNLLSNAVKFTEKGSVRITARRMQGNPPQSPLSLRGDVEGLVEISVADTGIGIGKEDIPKLFQAFSRIDSPLRAIVPGTGLGLYLTGKLMTTVLKGEIMVQTEIGQGSRFTIKMPVVANES